MRRISTLSATEAAGDHLAIAQARDRRPDAQGSADEYTQEEIRAAQEALDWHPANSPYWDQAGQDELAVIVNLNLTPSTSESERRENYRRALLGPDD